MKGGAELRRPSSVRQSLPLPALPRLPFSALVRRLMPQSGAAAEIPALLYPPPAAQSRNSPEGEGYKVFLSFNAALVGDALDKVFLAVEEEQQRGDHIHARHCEGETDLTGIDVGQKHRKRLGVGVL